MDFTSQKNNYLIKLKRACIDLGKLKKFKSMDN